MPRSRFSAHVPRVERTVWTLVLAAGLVACPTKDEQVAVDGPRYPPRAESSETDADPGNEPPPGIPRWSEAFRYEIAANEDRLVVSFTVQDGFHAYAEGESVGRPLLVELDEDGPVQPAGEIRYPAGDARELPIGRSVIVEGSGKIVAPIRIDPKAAPSETPQAKGKLHYQVCTEQMCDRPRTKTFQVPVH